VGHGGGEGTLFNELAILGLAVAAQALHAQSPVAARPERPYLLSTTAELVLLDVSVKDSVGERISNLTQSNFTVFENGKQQKISHFANEDVPVTVGLVIDSSGSMRPKSAEVNTAALTFIRSSNRKDEVFVVNFGDRVTYGLPEGVPFAVDLRQLRAALSLAIPAGRTALYDGILSALRHLDLGKWDKKALMLVSDGGDNSSTHSSEEVLRVVRETRATIYSIGIFDAGDPDKNPALLKRLSQISGGEAYFPAELGEVDGICQQIAGDIRTRYTIGYVPLRSGEAGAVRKIKVSASTPSGRPLAVHTRTSYQLPPVRTSGL
jgi:VWFA-related protein